MLFVVVELSHILVPCALFPDAFPFPQPFAKLTLVVGTICPLIQTIAIRFAIYVCAFIAIPVSKLFNPSPMLQKLHELSFICTDPMFIYSFA